MRKIGVGCVVYEPSKKTIERFDEADQSGFLGYFYDNSPGNPVLRDFAGKHSNVKYYTGGKNLGLGIGLSTICSQAYYDGCAALIFFDQDTVFDVETLDAIEKFYLDHPELSIDHSGVVFSSDGWNSEKGRAETRPCDETVLAINSGCLFFLDNLRKINWHNQNYFVDGVDYEYCLNSKINGFKIGRCVCVPGIDHETEQDDDDITLLGRRYRARRYRLYRVMDVLGSSLKLICRSTVRGELRFAAIVTRHLVVYIATQIFMRVNRGT